MTFLLKHFGGLNENNSHKHRHLYIFPNQWGIWGGLFQCACVVENALLGEGFENLKLHFIDTSLSALGTHEALVTNQKCTTHMCPDLFGR